MIPEPHQENTKLIFFERSPFMSVELLDLLNDYKIICYNDDSIYRLLKENWNVSSYLDTDFTKELANDAALEILLADKAFIEVNVPRGGDKALFFYMNSKINELVENAGISTLLPSYEVQENLGNKLHLPDICKELDMVSNESLIFEKSHGRSGEIFEECRRELGLPFVVQGSLGVSGEDTFLINTENELRDILESLPGEFKAARYIRNNVPVSVQICILPDQIVVQGPFLQLVGFPELSAKSFQFAGNDTNQSIFDSVFIEKVTKLSLKIGEYARAKKYKGILGVDYLWDKSTDTIYPQELNARLVGLTRLLTGIQKDQSILPDLIKHIEAFSVPSYSEKCELLNHGNVDLSQNAYSQVIIYNNLPRNVTVTKHIEPSIYRVDGDSLCLVKTSLFVEDIKADEVLITHAAHEGRELYPGGMIARIILKKSVIKDGEYKLEEKAVELIKMIRGRIIGEYV
ncbi:MAG: hypothetical protein Q8P01_04855 [bacterium]|nr:hypothetical protein [bacterium]